MATSISGEGVDRGACCEGRVRRGECMEGVGHNTLLNVKEGVCLDLKAPAH